MSVSDSVDFIRSRTDAAPRVLIVLGSGLGELADELSDPVAIEYDEIPGFPRSTVEGHAGRLVIGQLEGVMVAAMQGRFHLYEGWSARQVGHPVRVLARMGVETMIVTNAAGGIRRSFRPGTLMLIADHINLTGENPLRGPLEQGEVRFPDMSEAYDPQLREIARAVARDLRAPLAEGVYAALLGPSYETPAEIGMLDRHGADAVGMSTVPEVTVARANGIRVLGISCVTNPAAGTSPAPLLHDDVVREAERARDRLAAIVRGTLARIDETEAREPW